MFDNQVGAYVDTHRGAIIDVVPMSMVSTAAENYAKQTERVVEILPQCTICKEFYKPTDEYQPGFCSLNCYS